MSLLPEGFAELEPWVEDWARPTRVERYETRLSKTFDELCDFYDAIAAHAEAAIAHLDELDLQVAAEDDTRLLHLLYSMILVSYAVNIFHQPRIPDSGSAFFDMVARARRLTPGRLEKVAMADATVTVLHARGRARRRHAVR